MLDKSINLKHVRKYALERFKRTRSPAHNQLRSIEADTSRASSSGAGPNPKESRETVAYVFGSGTRSGRRQSRRQKPPTTPLSRLKLEQHQRQLQSHKYTDADRVELKRLTMASNGGNNETKPLTQANNSQRPRIQPKYSVHRDVLTHEMVIQQTGYGARDKSIPSGLRRCWRNWSFLALFTGIIPILQWLPKYSPRRDFAGDVIAGCTVAVMNIPHGMAYGLLAGVSAGNGLYMAIFPVLCYMVLGTSRHISIGTFAVISMMTLKVVQTHSTHEHGMHPPEGVASEDVITPLEVATTLALTVGIVHLLMGLFRLGTLAALLSDPLVNGFTTGAACHVITSQLKDVLGVSVPRYKGAFKIIYTLIDLGKSVPQTNKAALLFCLGVIVFMTICNECIKPCLRKRCRFPLPAELIAVVGGTLIAKYLQVQTLYGVKPVGTVPNSLPAPVLPRLDLIPVVAVDSIAIAIVSYSVVMSMGLTFAKKHSYELRANQELFALGVGNLVSACFSCYPLACSLSRSVIQEQTGGATQLASLVSVGLILLTILWAGPFFGDLPRCVLAAVIIVALKPMFMQAKDLKKFSKQGKLELLTWISTFISVVLIDIDIGLLIGVSISLLGFYIKGLKPYSALLGSIPEAAAVYVDINHHRNAVEVPETKIFRYTGSLNFASSMFFRRALYEALGLDGKAPAKRVDYKPVPVLANGDAGVSGGGGPNGAVTHLGDDTFRFLILDFGMLGHIDVAGSSTVSDVMKEMQARNVRVLLACPADRVYDSLVHSMALGAGPFEIFPTLHDAVEYANALRTA